MSAENVEVVGRANVEALRPVYEEWGRGNWRPRFDVYAPDYEWGWSEEFPGLEGVSSDPEVRSRRLREWLSPWEEWRCEAEEYVSAGELVVVLTRYTGRGKESGVSVDTKGAHLWTMRDGKAVRLVVFSSRSKALEAAGLSAA
jgi:ketosteroid isomerase-like protein